jgi:predicted GIY-YIG superfamily endonuclease
VRYVVYILRCSDDALYIGHSGDVGARLASHRQGVGCAFTATRLPVELVYSEPHATRVDAARRERQLKGWTRAKKEALIAGDLSLLKQL